MRFLISMSATFNVGYLSTKEMTPHGSMRVYIVELTEFHTTMRTGTASNWKNLVEYKNSQIKSVLGLKS